jgi:hypothetical protein
MQTTRLIQVLIAAVLLLLVANVALLAFVLNVRHRIIDTAVAAADELQRVREQSPDNTFSAHVAVDETLTIPVHTSVPINTAVNVPVVVPILGQQVAVRVPIQTSVPIDTTIRVPVKATVPVEVSAGALFGDVLQQVHDWLIGFSQSL